MGGGGGGAGRGFHVVGPVEVAAGVAGAAALLVVHADGDGTVVGDAHAVGRVREPALRDRTGAKAAPELAAHLRRKRTL